MKQLHFIGQYFRNVIVLLLSFPLPFLGFLFIGRAMKKQDPAIRLYSICGILLALLYYLLQYIL